MRLEFREGNREMMRVLVEGEGICVPLIGVCVTGGEEGVVLELNLGIDMRLEVNGQFSCIWGI